jgi:quinol monooxygenase YgiN
MLVIAGQIRIKPERRDDAVRLALDVARETVKEQGCRSYRFYADLEDPGLFFIFEEWDGPEALERHFTTPHMARFMTEVPALVGGEIDIKRYEVGAVSKMM